VDHDDRSLHSVPGAAGGDEYVPYAMPMFAVFPVSDVARSALWYREALGFGVVSRGPAGIPSVTHLRLGRYQDLLLLPAATSVAGSGTAVVTFMHDDVDALAARAHSVEAIGLVAIVGPRETSWETRDLLVTDPDGYRIVFSSPSAHALDTGRWDDPGDELGRRHRAAG
jgi:catechol 2,3-dioxygenase-like lactoylglutathione lyase family enzyme